MVHSPNRIVIVQEGVFKPEEYASWIETIKGVLESATVPPKRPDNQEKPAAVVEIVSSWQEAKEKACRHEVDTVIFISVGMIKIAHDFRREFNDLTVYVFPGREVEGEPYIIPKSVLTFDAIQQIAKGYTK